MKNKTLYKLQLLVLAGAVLLGLSLPVGAQTRIRTVSGTLVDDQGAPLSGVTVYNPMGKTAISDSAGHFEIDASDELSLRFEKADYDTKLVPVAGIPEQIALNKSEFLASENDLIKMGISTIYKREMTGAASTISPEDHLTYDHTQYVRDYIQGLLLGITGFSDIRGFGGTLFVIDGACLRFFEFSFFRAFVIIFCCQNGGG